GSWKQTAVLLLSDPELLNKPFYLSLCIWLNLGSLSLVMMNLKTCPRAKDHSQSFRKTLN
ncbi:hypothetical protein XENOCAPTIV_029234, partial [Xenoophorus captivus]